MMDGSPMVLSIADVMPAAAEIFVALAACVLLLVEAAAGARARNALFVLAIAALAGAAWVTAAVGPDGRTVVLAGHFVADPMGTVLKLFAYGAAALSLLYSRDYLERRELLKGEYLVLALFTVLGIQVIVSAGSLLSLYLGIEIMSLSLYALVAFDREDGVAAESAMKYFVLGAISSGALLYGISLLFGVTGSFLVDGIAAAVAAGGAPPIGLLFGLAFIVVGVAFKFGAVPFHMWLPDVYHGAPTPVTLFVAAAPKIASFALAMRILAEALGGAAGAWQDMLIVLAALSMAVGNVVAIAQTNIKRLLAYSTISHVGFILLGVLAGNPAGYRAAMFYTLTYVVMTTGAFGIVLWLSRKGFEADALDDYKGLNRRNPWFAFVMLLVMFGLAGVPPTVGFWAKLQVIAAVLDVGLAWLAALAVVLSVVGAYYYLRIVKLMYFDEPATGEPVKGRTAVRVLLSVNGLAILALGLYPGLLLRLCERVIP
jgi:NADH-quinone oxidoreductase subunit N